MVNRTSELLRTGGVIPPYQSGFFIGSPSLSSYVDGGSSDVTTSIVIPILIQETVNVDGVSIRVRSGGVAYSGWKFGLYNIDKTSDPASLGSALVEATGLNSGGSGTNTVHSFTSTQLTKGAYWMAFAVEAGSGSINAIDFDTGPSGSGVYLTYGNVTGLYDITTGTTPAAGFTVTGNSISAGTTFNGQTDKIPVAGLRVA